MIINNAPLISSSETQTMSSTYLWQMGKVIAPCSMPPADPSEIVGLESIWTIRPALIDSYMTAEFSG